MMSKKGRRETQLKKLFSIFDICFQMVLVKIRKKDVFKGGGGTCGLKKVLIKVARFI